MVVNKPYRRKRGEVWAFVFKNKTFLKKPLYLNFATEEDGDRYAANLAKQWAKGLSVPEKMPETIRTIEHLVKAYSLDSASKVRDRLVLGTVCNAVGTTPLDNITAKWVDDWISDMKRIDKLAPATIRGKVGALARCCSWGVRKGFLEEGSRPLQNLPEGYANYSQLDASLAGVMREDIERDRRLERGEFEKIMAVIDSGVLPRKQRPYVLPQAALRTMLILAVESGMRLREMFTLTVDQVDLGRRTVFLDKTKNGDRRQVPLSTAAMAALKDYLPDQGQLFPWWDGVEKKKNLDTASDVLSKLWINLFEVAGCKDLKAHDLRHEAVCRLYEKTTLTDLQISKITGHRNLASLRRYANLRGSTLAEFLP